MTQSDGRPSFAKSSVPRQSGCDTTPTRKPCASSQRAIIACPKLGWSTYASPVIISISILSHPRARTSSMLTGRNAPRGGLACVSGFAPRAAFFLTFVLIATSP